MSDDKHDSIPDFSLVGPTIWEYERYTPKQISQDAYAREQSPDLVIIFSWTGANGKHVLKYTQHYQSLFPSSRIFVITTSIKDFFFRSTKRKQARLQPAVDRILQYKANDILIHAFSEGGSGKAADFAEAYYNTTGQRMPCSAFCLDSTPGSTEFMPLLNAVRKSLPPHPVLQISGTAVSWVVFGTIWIGFHIFKGGKKASPIARTRLRLLDDKTWDHEAPRCYLYSKKDDLIQWKDVQAHAFESQQKGIPINQVLFEDSAHCKHMASEPSKYWDGVLLTWNQAISHDLLKNNASMDSLSGRHSKASSRSDTDSERTLG